MAETPELGRRIGAGRTAEIFALGDDRVVKLFYPGFSEFAIQTEARASQLVAKAGLPAPGFFGLVEINGRQGTIYERLAGETMLARLVRRPHELLSSTRKFADLHRQLHQYEVSELISYRDCLADRIQNAPGLITTQKDQLINCLRCLPSGRQVVCHGDFHPDNIMLTDRGPVIIDWMNARSGEAVADVARTLLLLAIGTPAESGLPQRLMIALFQRIFSRRYQTHYLRDSKLTRPQVQAWLPVIAAARLTEGIEDETSRLLTLATSAI
jgi:Ser/Thr protein kinase RdoA (MazF antagonist)